VRLRIYDVTGRLVRTLLDREEKPGTRQIVWDGRDDDGTAVALGLYVCSFQAPGYHRTQKLVRIE
jgi:flagellar hook assembly protein FlgD